jgi:hypothetical protein
MSARFLFLHVAPGVQAIYNYGGEPKVELFHEFSDHFYELYEKSHGKCSEKLYSLTPVDASQPANEVLTVTESQKKAMLDAAIHLENMFKSERMRESAPQNPISFEEKLEILTKVLPPVFFSDTRFHKHKDKSK